MTRAMFDAVDVKDVPASGFDLLGGYVNGAYQSYGPLKARFPGVTVVSIDVLNHPGSAQVLDIEQGDATPQDAPVWFDASKAQGIERPTLYYSSSLHPDILRYMGSRKFDAWIASYGVSECPIRSDGQVTVVAWQKADHGPSGENIDVSDVFDDTWNPTSGTGGAMTLTQADLDAIVKALEPVIVRDVAEALRGLHYPPYHEYYAAARKALGLPPD